MVISIQPAASLSREPGAHPIGDGPTGPTDARDGSGGQGGHGDDGMLVLAGATLRDRAGLSDIVVRGGVVERIVPSVDADGATWLAAGARVVDLDGALVLPGYADAHVHLDKAFQLDLVEEVSRGGGIDEALRATATLNRDADLTRVEANARETIRTLAAGGTVAIRAHVEIDAGTELERVHLHTRLAAEFPDLAFEFVAFAQYGSTHDAAIVTNLDLAMQNGCTVVGGCPYADEDPLGHLEQMIALAKRHNAPLDLHLDLSDRVDDLLLGDVLARLVEADLPHPTLIGHETALTAAAPDVVERLARAAADAGVVIAAIPTTDLFLSGRGGAGAPTRGVTRIREFLDAGTDVVLASNNHENAFTPVTLPTLGQAAWLASLTNHFATTGDHLRLLDAITTVPRRVFREPVPGLDVGDRIGAAVFRAGRAVDVVRRALRPVAVVTSSGLRELTETAPRERQAANVDR